MLATTERPDLLDDPLLSAGVLLSRYLVGHLDSHDFPLVKAFVDNTITTPTYFLLYLHLVPVNEPSPPPPETGVAVAGVC